MDGFRKVLTLTNCPWHLQTDVLDAGHEDGDAAIRLEEPYDASRELGCCCLPF